MTLTRGAIIALLAALAIVAGGATVSPAFAQPVPTQSDIQFELDSAKADRAYSAGRLDKARQRRELAEQARKNARDARNAADRNDWNRTAREHDRLAADMEEKAAGLIAAAERREAKARRLQERLNAATQADERRRAAAEAELRQIREAEEREAERRKTPYKLKLEDAIGVWRFKDDDAPFVIVPEDPEIRIYDYRLEAHTNNRVWKGTYTPFDEGDPSRLPEQTARIVFRYKPKAAEMNPVIPEWARKAVEDQLEWRLELDESGSDVDPGLSLKWYPGEVSWTEDLDGDRMAEVIGDGDPRTLEIEPEYRIQISDLAQSMLSIGLGGAHDAETHPIEALIKGQRFFIKVNLPPKMAKEQGNTLTVSFKGLGGGDTTTLDLTGTGGTSAHRAVAYTHDKPVTIADCDIWTEPKREPQFLSLFWIFGVEGACLNLDVDNVETVEVRFGESYQQVVLYNSWVQRGIARHAQGAERMRALLGSVVDGNYTGKQKEGATKRLRMILNYEALMASGKLTDLHRFHVGELYFSDTGLGVGIIFMEDAAIDRYWEAFRKRPDTTDANFFNPLMKAYLEGLSGKNLDLKAHTVAKDIAWAMESEKGLVVKTLRRTSKRFSSDAVKSAAKNFTFGMYDGFVSATGAGEMYLVVTGRDHFDRPLPAWMRLNAALGLASGAVLTISGSRAAQAFVRSSVRRKALAGIARSDATLVARGSRGVEKIDGFQDAADLPRSLDATQRSRSRLQLEADPSGTGGPRCSSRSKGKPRPRTILAPGDDVDLLELFRKEDYAQQIYGDGVEFTDPFGGDLFPIQTRQSCNEMSSNYSVWRKTGNRVSENAGHQRIFGLMRDEVLAGKRASGDLHSGAGFFHGYDQRSIRNYLRSMGAKVAETPVAQNARIKLRHIWSALEKGWSVKIVISVPGGGKHAVIVDGLDVSPSGAVVKVRVYDPNIGQLIRVPARNFNRVIDRGNTSYGIMTMFRFDQAP